MTTLTSQLLERGYLPKELPPCFSSSDFSNWVARVGASRPKPNQTTSLLATHSLARAGGVRRILSIPNPAHFVELCSEIESGWGDILAAIGRPALSQSVPTPGGILSRAVEPLHALGDLSLVKVKNRRAARYILAADVAEYYRSLYTHSIPWALHGKELAKREQRNRGLLGNRIDTALRNIQDKQTNPALFTIVHAG